MSNFLQHTTIKRRGGYKVSPSLLLPLFFQYHVLLTLVLLLLDRHEEKEERRGRDVLEGACRLVRGAAPTVRGRVRAAVRAAGRAAGPDAPACRGARGPRRLVEASGRPVHGTRRRVGPRRVAAWPTVRRRGGWRRTRSPGWGASRRSVGGCVSCPPGAARGGRPAEARGPPRRGRVVRAGGGSSRSSGGRRSCGGIRRRRTGSRR
jgi:hypothetical protein